MPKPTQAEFKAFERIFNKIRKAAMAKRREATGTLTPGVMRRHLENGAPLDLLFGVRPDGTPFTAEDLRAFDKRAQAVRKKFQASKRGVRIDQLISASRSVDIQRANKLSSATMYRIFNSKDGVVLHFRVTASKGSPAQFHQVRIRLEEWSDWLTSTLPFKQAAEKILNGRISFDCDCGRHQFWYRYLATVGGFALNPLEHSYPKIRNPRLTGACCKHTLKALHSIRGPAVRRIIIKEMEKAAEQIGYGDDAKAANRYLNQQELEKAARSSAAKKGISLKAAREAFKQYLAAKRGIARKVKEKKTMDALEKKELELKTVEKIARKELAGRKAAEVKEQKAMDKARKIQQELEQKDLELAQKSLENKQLRADAIKGQLYGALMAAKYRDNIPVEQAIADFAKANDVPVNDVQALAEGMSV